jgi:hypothetical protein
MNERFKELAEQAAISCGDFIGPRLYMTHEEEMEKFAELIVRECAKVINADIEYQIKDGIISNVHGLNQARNLINEHFGVEE